MQFLGLALPSLCYYCCVSSVVIKDFMVISLLGRCKDRVWTHRVNMAVTISLPFFLSKILEQAMKCELVHNRVVISRDYSSINAAVSHASGVKYQDTPKHIDIH